MTRPFPWYVGVPGNGLQYTIEDADGKLVCECDGEDNGKEEAFAICAAMNLANVARMNVNSQEF